MQQVSEADRMADRVKQGIVLPASDLHPTVYKIAERFSLSLEAAYGLVEAAKKVPAKERNSTSSL